ncbi:MULTISPECIES: hypothetical protein [unclassified Bosea (in: a-proteobacteria)]|uniref:hypothetical protein n=1 Tax=unclassified Bosea (in: a-proteobacteria) TaxID=2653178 RepID=UPI000F760CCE|nr:MULTISPECIES: hypothetical protein [unclassified Bosea (in: a-proteobacteria)]AZO77609.1 hypothetical protein BLM15_08265 [Bosea sp. Tri-49]RXT18215.1 hypothetical protein B5U98_23425 [Bosea sp. Tri-39]RXT32811.1 hypothetical protein B5U99_29770 [Bosea sp. Tri-54]
MAYLPAGRALLLACLVALPLGACVAGHADSSAGRASALATTVSRAIACRAGSPQRTTLDRFIAAEKARGANDEQLAAARSAYVTVSEAEMINQDVRPQPCTAEERAALRGKMNDVRAGRFEAP